MGREERSHQQPASDFNKLNSAKIEVQLNTVWKMSLLIKEKKTKSIYILEDITSHRTKAAMAAWTLRKHIYY